MLFVVGALLLGLAGLMLLPAAADLIDGSPDWRGFLTALAITAAVGGVLVLGFRQPRTALDPREGFLLATLAALALALFGALPFMLSSLRLGTADALLEATSGITTTGTTVLRGLDRLPHGILLWRALLQLVGGIGAIVLGVVLLPVLRVGGMQLFRMEQSDRLERIRPRLSKVTGLLVGFYLALAALCALALLAAGMGGFDALCHAMAAVSTGGFSTHDASIGYFASPAIEAVLVVFMVLGASPFPLLLRAVRGDPRAPWRDSQLRWYLAYLLLALVVLAGWQMLAEGRPGGAALRAGLFAAASLGTSTGFTAGDPAGWGPLPIAVALGLCFIGGCTGSAAGGIKLFRLCVLGNAAHWQVRHLVHPHRMLPITYNGQPIADEVVRSVFCFVAFTIGCCALLTLALSACGLDLATSLRSVVRALGNAGPALGPLGGGAGDLPGAAKLVLCLAMLLGRLELLTVLVLLSPTFWRG